MNTLAIIAEYNPFHNGHQYHLKRSLKKTGATHSLAVMSGHFVQRGEPALLDKWLRAKMAVDSGLNLVIELPVMNAISSAENFAYGAISLINQLNIVDDLSFGSESGDLSLLKRVSEFLAKEPDDFKKSLRTYLDGGLSFPDARHKALIDQGFNTEDLKSNDILGVEYLKAIRRLNSDLEVTLINRQYTDYHSTKLVNQFASATAIRNWIKHQDFLSVRMALPQNCYRTLANETRYAFQDDLYPLVRYALTVQSSESLDAIHEITEGLENRMTSSARQMLDMEEFLSAVKTRRFTMTRIKRALLNILLQITSEEVQQHDLMTPKIIRLLAADEKGLELLKLIKEKSPLPIVTNLNKFETTDPLVKRQLDLTIQSSDLYSLIRNEPLGQEYLNSPYIKK
jgi:predicted nucleotidyltransferase